jgi:hypothetical protein
MIFLHQEGWQPLIQALPRTSRGVKAELRRPE